MNRVTTISFVLMTLFLTSCSNEQIYNVYMQNNRVSQYQKLHDRYDGIKVILWMNENEDSWWITNFTLWALLSIFTDMPDFFAGIAVWLIMWRVGMLGNGGAILRGLASIGGILGGVMGVTPAIMGIIYLGVIFVFFQKMFSLLF